MPHAIARASMVVIAAGLLLMGFSAPPATAEDFPKDDETPAIVRPRVRVAVHNGEEIDIRDCLSNAVEAANSENLDGFVNCFTGNTKSKIRKQAAIRFVQHDVAMELLDTQVIKAGKTTGEVAVKYRLVLTEERFDVVSLVAVKQENGYWRINSEKIQSYEHQSPSMCSPSRYACLGATCRVAAR
jgi:hypothetical protein